MAEVNLKTGDKAGCIFVGGEEILAETPMEYFGAGFDMLNRMLRSDSMVHRGIYAGNANDLRCYTMISGLAAPADRLKQLVLKAHMSTDVIAQYLGVEDG